MPVQMDYPTSMITYTSNGDPTTTTRSTSFTIGDTVYINGEGDYRGKVCYIGEVHFAKGEYAGVALEHPLGHHDGAYRGRRYFQCEGNHGVFARVGKISRLALIPASNDSERCGLYREGRSVSPPRSLSPSPSQRTVSFGMREGSPYSSSYSTSGFSSYSSDRRSFSKSPSPTPSGGSGSGFYYSSSASGITSTNRSRNHSGGTSRPTNLKMGDRVIVASSVGETKTGVLRYLGPVEFASGEYAGIELFHPLGKNDGTVRGRHYFTCQHPFGLFVPSYKVESSPANKLGVKLLGTRDNVHKILEYSNYKNNISRAGGVLRGTSYEEDFY